MAAIVMIAIGVTLPARGDEISPQQEAIRAPLRAAYVKAKQAEQDAIDRRQKAIDRMTALLQAGNRELDQIQGDLKTAQSRLDDKRQEQKLAAKALDVALGSHGRDASDPAVVAAQARLDAVNAEVKDLEQQVAQLEQSQRDKISIPNSDPIYKELIDASAELDQRRQDTVKAMAAYVAVIKPQAPPYLQSVQVYVGAAAKYRAEWRIDDQAADSATHELTGRLEKILRDLRDALDQMQAERDDLRQERQELISLMFDFTGQINAAVVLIDYNGEMLVIVPAVIEAVGVVVEAMLTGGASTAERHAVEQAVDAGAKLGDALFKKRTGQVLSVAEMTLIAHIDAVGDEVTDAMMAFVQAAIAKHGSDKMMNGKANDVIDKLGLKPGNSDATKVVVGDVAEQLIGRTSKAASVYVGTKVVAGLAAASADKLSAWQAVRSGASTFYSAKVPMSGITEAFKGSLKANLVGVVVTTAKALAAKYFGEKLGQAQQSYLEGLAKFNALYQGYYALLKVDQMLFDKQRELQNLYFETFTYRLKSAGPRKLVVMQNDGVNPAEDDVTVALHFSEPLDKPPQVRLLGIQFDMKPQDKNPDGRSAFWEGKVSPKKLPNNVKEGVLEVKLIDGSTPYKDLDSDPSTPARFVVPDDLTKDLPDREEWSDFERGADKSHHIAFTAPQAQLPVPWRDRSTCDKIDCDCGAVPVRPGIGGDFSRRGCERSEKQLRDICAQHGQTLGACPVAASGPKAYPLPHNLSATTPPGGPAPINPLTPTPPSPSQPTGPSGPSAPPRPVMPKPPLPPIPPAPTPVVPR